MLPQFIRPEAAAWQPVFSLLELGKEKEKKLNYVQEKY